LNLKQLRLWYLNHILQARSCAYTRTPVRIIIVKSRKTENSNSALKLVGWRGTWL